MSRVTNRLFGVLWLFLSATGVARSQEADALLPPGVKAVWNLDQAWRQKTPTRERMSINGLWRWQPAEDNQDAPPAKQWGYFKAPGCWPGIEDYLQTDSQTLYAHPAWKDRKLGEVRAAWYEREITLPSDWRGRRILLSAQYVNSLAAVFIDGRKQGEIAFPAGEVDLTSVCRPGNRFKLNLLVTALPMKGVLLSYTDTAAARQIKGDVPRRGLCGDIELRAVPMGPGIEQVKVDPSVRRGEITFSAAGRSLADSATYCLRARILDRGKTVADFQSRKLTKDDFGSGRLTFTEAWRPDRLWDLVSADNQLQARLSLLDADGQILDEADEVSFGFRELWIDGRDFILNGSRIDLCAVPIDSAVIGASHANYAAARETLRRLRKIGINLVYAHNYDCQPGAHVSYDEILRAADDEGMLVALTQPHFSQYEWTQPDSDQTNSYAKHAAFYVQIAQNHPSVVFYAMSHNATGYNEDMNPDLIDGIHDRREPWSSKNAAIALRAEAIVHRFDPSRIVYHHAGGNIGSMHSSNFYPNFAPAQELSDWFEHWAKVGIKPAFTCEYGAPFTWDWTMYRGWYKGQREFGSAAAPWEFCLAEWNSQFLGDRAFAIGEREKQNLRWEAEQFRAGKVWRRWDYPTVVGSPAFEDRNRVMSLYLADNWRAFRTWGVSGISPWEYQMFWQLRAGVDTKTRALAVDWERLQRPGLSPDFAKANVLRIDSACAYDDWIPTAAGEALLRNNQPALMYIAGKGSAFTSKDHNFTPGETVEKQVIVINNSRRRLHVECQWKVDLPEAVTGRREFSLETGQRAQAPITFMIPAGNASSYQIVATARFDSEPEQSDTFRIHCLPASQAVSTQKRIALFDPMGQTAALLKSHGVRFSSVDATADLSSVDLLVIGKLAMTPDGAMPNLSRVSEGMRVVVFEQSAEALEKRLGFRVTEYGLRQVFDRIPDHPILAQTGAEQVRDWRGEATTTPPRLTYETREQHGPTIRWCDLPVTRVWRCGNRGNVASILIEKPARGDFRPILDGGFSLQYTPLMEYRQGSGMVLFCQLDVTGRTEPDPAAEQIVTNLLHHGAEAPMTPSRQAIYIGDPSGARHLSASGVQPASLAGGEIPSDAVLVVGPGGQNELASRKDAVSRFLENDGHVVLLGLSGEEANRFLPLQLKSEKREHIEAVFDAPALDSPLCAIGPADLFNRGPRQTDLITGGATLFGDGILALAPKEARHPGVVCFQLPPWTMDYRNSYNLKRTYRRLSYALNRVLANAGVRGETPLLTRFASPVKERASEGRYRNGFYLDIPEEWDDPYRFFRW